MKKLSKTKEGSHVARPPLLWRVIRESQQALAGDKI